VVHVREQLGGDRISERRTCRVLGQSRSTQRRTPDVPEDEPLLVKRMVELATQYGRYGYRRITALLRREGWRVQVKFQIDREEALMTG
jgi:putative transposase